jgi:hypothetical protein
MAAGDHAQNKYGPAPTAFGFSAPARA